MNKKPKQLIYKHFNKAIVRTPLNSLNKHGDTNAKLNPSPLFLEGLFLSSAEFYSEYIKKTPNLDDKLKLTFNKYWIRSCVRGTPYGTFAGCGIVDIVDSEKTNLILDDEKTFSKSIRLDMNFLTQLIQAMSIDPKVQTKLLYFPNNSIYALENEYRYVEYEVINDIRHHTLSTIEKTHYISNILDQSLNGRYLIDLAKFLVESEEVDLEEAIDFIQELIDSKLLISQLEPVITGISPLENLINQLTSASVDQTIIKWLETIKNALKHSEQGVDDYNNTIDLLNSNPWSVSLPKHLFHTDLYTEYKKKSISNATIEKIIEQCEDLHVFSKELYTTDLDIFKAAFLDKFSDQDIDLTIALDADIGVGYAEITDKNTGGSIYIDNLATRRKTSRRTVEGSFIQDFTFKKHFKYLQEGADHIEITDEDIESLKEHRENLTLPNSMTLMGSLFEDSKATDSTNFKFHLSMYSGPSGANLITRFSNEKSEFTKLSKAILLEEEKENPDFMYAEIAHLPQARDSNILLRPVLRTYEIPYVGLSGAIKENLIPVNDITICVINGEIILKSKKFKKRIIPRLTSAHNFSSNCLPIYKFLCDLQDQGMHQPFIWEWGPLNFVDQLPRVQYKNLILKKAEWTIKFKEIEKFSTKDSLVSYFKEIRIERKIPQFVDYARGDNFLLIDLDNSDDISLLSHFIKRYKIGRLYEHLYNENNCTITDKKGNPYSNELIIPLYMDKLLPKIGTETTNVLSAKCKTDFHIGSEWLYFKLYCGASSADKILKNSILPFVNDAQANNLFEKFFYIRYWDTSNHLRIRFYNSKVEKNDDLQKAFLKFANSLIEQGMIHNIIMDSYKREIRRYSEDYIVQSESIFFSDSLANLQLLNLLHGTESEKYRLLIALRSIDSLLEDFGYTIFEKHSLLANIQESFFQEFGGSKFLKNQLNNQFRDLKPLVFSYLNFLDDEKNDFIQVGKILRVRSILIKKVFEEMKSENINEEMIFKLLPSYIHMSLNRLFIGKQRVHELLIYTLLERYYKSMMARVKTKNDA